MEQCEAKFNVGAVIHHKRYGYRGVIVDADPTFALPELLYERVANSGPPIDRPWYHVLVHASDQLTYVAESNLELDGSGDPIRHPLIGSYFRAFRDGRYVSPRQAN
jgi:heat shock protein HspQ